MDKITNYIMNSVSIKKVETISRYTIFYVTDDISIELNNFNFHSNIKEKRMRYKTNSNIETTITNLKYILNKNINI